MVLKIGGDHLGHHILKSGPPLKSHTADIYIKFLTYSNIW